MDNQLSDTDRQILDLWEGMKPREAKALKFIVMDESGTFAGQFTCDIDPHGDRYFLIKQAPKSGKWSLLSNLVTNLEAAEEGLPKTAIKYREEYKETISRSVYRLDLDSSDQDNAAGQDEREHREVSTLPAFDYSPREGVRPNTDEWGKANIMICANFAIEASLYAINYQAQIYRNGKGSRSVSADVVWGAVRLLAAELDSEMANCLEIVENSIKDLCFSKLIDENICFRLPNGDFELVGEAQEGGEPSEEYEIEGLTFPILEELSPEKIHHYSSRPREWAKMFPEGEENWSKIATTSKLLRENRIDASLTESGLWLYTANLENTNSGPANRAASSSQFFTESKPSEELSDLGNMSPLTGQALIQKIKTLGDASPQQLAKACGYASSTNGNEYIDVESYYSALFEAYRK